MSCMAHQYQTPSVHQLLFLVMHAFSSLRTYGDTGAWSLLWRHTIHCRGSTVRQRSLQCLLCKVNHHDTILRASLTMRRRGVPWRRRGISRHAIPLSLTGPSEGIRPRSSVTHCQLSRLHPALRDFRGVIIFRPQSPCRPSGRITRIDGRRDTARLGQRVFVWMIHLRKEFTDDGARALVGARD